MFGRLYLTPDAIFYTSLPNPEAFMRGAQGTLDAYGRASVDERIVCFREKTGYGPLILKHVFPFGFSESTYKRIIKANGLSSGSKMEHGRCQSLMTAADIALGSRNS